MTSASDILKQIKDNDVKFVDLRFTDPRGKLQHVTMDAAIVDDVPVVAQPQGEFDVLFGQQHGEPRSL